MQAVNAGRTRLVSRPAAAAEQPKAGLHSDTPLRSSNDLVGRKAAVTRKLRLDFLSSCPLPAAMPTEEPADPVVVTATLVLAASLLMEDASAELVLPSHSTRQELAERVLLLRNTAVQLQALAKAARAALARFAR